MCGWCACAREKEKEREVVRPLQDERRALGFFARLVCARSRRRLAPPTGTTTSAGAQRRSRPATEPIPLDSGAARLADARGVETTTEKKRGVCSLSLPSLFPFFFAYLLAARPEVDASRLDATRCCAIIVDACMLGCLLISRTVLLPRGSRPPQLFPLLLSLLLSCAWFGRAREKGSRGGVRADAVEPRWVLGCVRMCVCSVVEA